MPTLNPETAIRKLILDDAGLGVTLGTRVYPGAGPNAPTYPLGVFERDRTEPQHNMSGPSDIKHVRSMWTWYGYDYDAMITLAEDVEAVLDGYRGTVTIGADSVTFKTLFLEEQADALLKPNDGTGRAVHQIQQTYFVAYEY